MMAFLFSERIVQTPERAVLQIHQALKDSVLQNNRNNAVAYGQ